MISFLTPWIFGVAVAASVMVTLLHFLSVRRPPAYALPTARFVVSRDVRAVSRSARPSDLLLLALRVLALLAAGAALAGPRWVRQQQSVAYVLVADPSWRSDSSTLRRIAGIDAAPANGSADAANAAVRLVWTDSGGGMRAELGAAWPTAWRTAGALLRDDPAVDSIAVHVFAPDRGSRSYAGWSAWRSTWPGAVRVHVRDSVTNPGGADRSRTAFVSAPDGAVSLMLARESRADDVVRAAFALHTGTVPPTAATDGGAAGSTTASTASTASTVRIEWPASGVPAGWRRMRDTVGALVSGGQAIVAPWVRESVAPDSLPANASVIAYWGDGRPAAIEYGRADGCDRLVAVSVPNASDVLNTRAAGALVRTLSAACGTVFAPVPRSIARDSAAPRRSLAAATDLRPMLPARVAILPRWLPAALLAAALLLLGIEQLLRRSRSVAAGDGA